MLRVQGGAGRGQPRAWTSSGSFLAPQPYLWSSLGQTVTDLAKAHSRPQTATAMLACFPIHYSSFIHSFIQHLLSTSHSAESDIVPDLKKPQTWVCHKHRQTFGLPTNAEEGKGQSLFRRIREGFKEASFGLDHSDMKYFYEFQQAEMRPGHSRQRE